ncbi:MAG: protein kinase [Myxococcales bacterium]
MMDNDLQRLVHEMRFAEAASLARSRGQSSLASDLFERACDTTSAALEALKDGDIARAVVLAAQGEDLALFESLLARVEPREASNLALDLERKRLVRWVAPLFERAGDLARAARAWERAGDAVRAAATFEGLGEPAEAVRVLEQAVRGPAVDVTLGAILLRLGRFEQAARALQRVPSDAAEHGDAHSLLCKALSALGLAPFEPSAPAPVPHAERGRRLFGRYEVVCEVASSPTARVVHGVDCLMGQHVALKILDTKGAVGIGRDAFARFEREAQVLQSLRHPNVVALSGWLAEGVLVFPWLSGGNLETLLAAGPLAPSRAKDITRAVLSALAEAHRLGILHRDIKPANVLFDEAGGVYLADFGVAHLGDGGATAAVFGTLAYMSPEQRRGESATVRSDLFAVGVMLGEMLTGEPFGCLPSAANQDLGKEHDALVGALTAEEPKDRPSSAWEALRRLDELRWLDRPCAKGPARRREAMGERLRVEAGEGRMDTWTGQAIERVELTEAVRRRVRAFARAGHPGLQTVLRVESDGTHVWLARPAGHVLNRALEQGERRTLTDALLALHAEGESHGAVDRAHVWVGEHGEVTLAFVSEPGVTPEEDIRALGRVE